MKTVTVRLPDFAAMSDEEMQHHSLTGSRDGRWSSLTLWLLERFGTDKLELGDAWSQTWTGWECPVCKRPKFEIARLTDNNVLLCQLDEHHDQRHAQRQSLALRPMARRPAFPTRPVRSPLVSAGSLALLQGWPTGNGRSPLVKAILGESEIAGQTHIFQIYSRDRTRLRQSRHSSAGAPAPKVRAEVRR